MTEHCTQGQDKRLFVFIEGCCSRWIEQMRKSLEWCVQKTMNSSV